MLIYVNEANSEQSIAINPKHVSAVFEAADGEVKGKTIVNMQNNSSWVVSQSQLEVVGMINGVLK
jgi:hypothetical protein